MEEREGEKWYTCILIKIDLKKRNFEFSHPKYYTGFVPRQSCVIGALCGLHLLTHLSLSGTFLGIVILEPPFWDRLF